MKLISLSVRNFMPYKGEHEITFALYGARNVVIINGDNMRGKTSILNALRWVLYGRVSGRHRGPIPRMQILNKDAAAERDFVVSVRLRFEHKGVEYELVRKIKPKGLVDTPREDDDFTAEIVMSRAGDQIAARDQIEHEINRVLPEAIARFSLFDGELLQEYEQLVAAASTESKGIKEAIEKALGVPALTNASNHVSTLKDRAQKQYAREGNQNSAQAKMIQSTAFELDDARKERDRLQSLLMGVVADRDHLEDELARFENAENVKAKLDENRRQQQDADLALVRTEDRRKTLAPRAWKALIATIVAARRQQLEAQLLQVNTHIEEQARTRAEHRLKLASLQSGTCALCGIDLSEPSRHHFVHATRSEHASADPAPLLSDLASASRQLEKLRELQDATIEDELTHTEREMDRTAVDLNRLKQRETALLDEIPGINLVDLGRKRERRDLLQREVGRNETLLAAKQAECAALQKKYDALMKAAVQQDSTKYINRRVGLLTILADVLERSVGRLRHHLKGRVQEAATATFKRLTTEKQYTGLRINDQYGLEIRDQLDRPVSVRSAGAEQIVALSLIDGLAHASGSPGLLVMDTPFGRLDLKHRAHVLAFLPSMAQQVVLLVHEGELAKDRDLRFINEHVAAVYDIERVSPTQSKLLRREEGVIHV